jgi:glutamine amidotransferase-like uncharacterized protein
MPNRKLFKLSIISLFVVLLITACQFQQAGNSIPQIALYSETGADERCIIATSRMFEWMDYGVTLVNADSINNISLKKFNIICFPGGDMYQYSQNISADGFEKIRNFIRAGGGYIGICGGAYFTGEKIFWQGNQLPMNSLAIFPGITRGPIDEIAPFPHCKMCKTNIVNTSHPITRTEPDTTWICYCYGPMFLPGEGAEIDILGRYDIGDQPSMAAFEYGMGRVFIIGTHPEFEEDSERDGFPAVEKMNDYSSDWDLMKKATQWCLKK